MSDHDDDDVLREVVLPDLPGLSIDAAFMHLVTTPGLNNAAEMLMVECAPEVYDHLRDMGDKWEGSSHLAFIYGLTVGFSLAQTQRRMSS